MEPAQIAHRLREHTGGVDAAVLQPREEERTGLAAAPHPDVSPRRQGGCGSRWRAPLGFLYPALTPSGLDLQAWERVHGGPALGSCLHAHGLIFLKRPKIFTDLKLKRKQEKPFKK